MELGLLMSRDLTGYRLAGHIPKPFLRDKAMAFIESAGKPVLLREIAVAMGVSPPRASRTMIALHDQGRVTRHQVRMSFPVKLPRGARCGEIVTGYRPMWLYSPAPASE